MNDILNCPFCGGGPTAGVRFDWGYIHCSRPSCPVKPQIRRKDKKDKSGCAIAIDAWNTRAQPAATVESGMLPKSVSGTSEPAATGGRVEITDEMIEAVYANITPNDILTGETEPVRRALAAALAKAGIAVNDY